MLLLVFTHILTLTDAVAGRGSHFTRAWALDLKGRLLQEDLNPLSHLISSLFLGELLSKGRLMREIPLCLSFWLLRRHSAKIPARWKG